MKNNSKKILFVHNTIMWYRIPFFKLLKENYDVNFIFTYLEASNNIYDIKYFENLKELEFEFNSCNAYLASEFRFLNEGIPIGLIKYLFFTNYDIIVDNLQSLKVLISYAASKIRKKPLIIWSEGWNIPNNVFMDKLKIRFAKLILNNSNFVLVPGTKHAEYISNLGIDRKKIVIMPNVSMIDNTNLEDIDTIKKKYGILEKDIILYVGRLIRRKGVHYLINGFSTLKKENKDSVLFIIGNGPCKEYLKELTEKLSISDSVFFLDFIKNDELPSYYNASSVCVIPSITYETNEPWGLVVNEAMQFQNPIIATEAVGSAYDLVQNGKNGFLIPERDENAIYESLKRIIDDKELKKKMGLESKRIIDEKFQYDAMFKGFESTINQLKK
ncbi:MAG: glycosyltransferase family 4 protein [Methanobacteriaceae archaeon]|nr:glycosyltransferase family 4 protein [Methanobacteriaceae archaeon]